MTQWVYKATRVRASYADAHDLAVTYHFLCKSIFAHGPASQGARELEMVSDVALGDVIHYYYRTPEARVRCLGRRVVLRVDDGRALLSTDDPLSLWDGSRRRVVTGEVGLVPGEDG